MKLSSWDQQLGLASPRESAASQSDQTNNPSTNEVRNEVGLDVSHHTRISQRGGEKFFPLTSFFIGLGGVHRGVVPPPSLFARALYRKSTLSGSRLFPTLWE